jgi:hypothetical protein
MIHAIDEPKDIDSFKFKEALEKLKELAHYHYTQVLDDYVLYGENTVPTEEVTKRMSAVLEEIYLIFDKFEKEELR